MAFPILFFLNQSETQADRIPNRINIAINTRCIEDSNTHRVVDKKITRTANKPKSILCLRLDLETPPGTTPDSNKIGYDTCQNRYH